MGLQLETPAAATAVVTLAEAKAYAKVDGTANDSRVLLMIPDAVGLVEEHLSRSLAEQGWLYTLPAFADEIDLPRGPVIAIDSVKYLDPDNVEQTLDSAVYTLDLVSDPARIVRNDGESWPALGSQPNQVRIHYRSGFGTVPAPIKIAILMTVATLFDNPAAGGLPDGALLRLQPWRSEWFAA